MKTALRKATLLVAGGVLISTGVLTTQATSSAGTPETVGTAARDRSAKPTVVLVHGAWADSSGWAKVVRRLQSRGYQVLAPSIPLRGLAGDSRYLKAFLRDRTTGPVVLVGHSYGGAVITNAARSDDDVEALVYVNAFVPDRGDSVLGLLDPNHALDPATLFDVVRYPGALKGDRDLYLKEDVFADAIANGIPARRARTMAATQRPVTLSALTARSGRPAWRSVPSFYLLGTEDHIVPVDLQRTMAQRAGAKISRVAAGHLPMITDARSVERLIVRADRATPTR